MGDVVRRWLQPSRACVDRWADEDQGRIAIRSEKETGETRELSFGAADVVARLAGALAGLGVTKGDAVAVYLPMGVEAVVSLLAAARIGAIFIPVFSGYGADAVATVSYHPRPKVMICADGFQRRGKLVEMKEVADEAIESAGGVERVLVVDYAGRPDTPMVDVSGHPVGRCGAERRGRPSVSHQHREPRSHRLHLGRDRETKGSGLRPRRTDCEDCRRGGFPVRTDEG